MKTIYEASDGKQFISEEECKKHEDVLINKNNLLKEKERSLSELREAVEKHNKKYNDCVTVVRQNSFSDFIDKMLYNF